MRTGIGCRRQLANRFHLRSEQPDALIARWRNRRALRVFLRRLRRRGSGQHRTQPHVGIPHARNQRRTHVVCAACQPVLMRDIQVPQYPVQEFRAIVDVEEVVVAGLDVDRQILLSNPLCVSNRPAGRIVGRKQIRIRPGPINRGGPPGPWCSLLRAVICRSCNPGSEPAPSPLPRKTPRDKQRRS